MRPPPTRKARLRRAGGGCGVPGITEKAPASEGGRYKGLSNPRGPGKPGPYKDWEADGWDERLRRRPRWKRKKPRATRAAVEPRSFTK